MDNQKPSLSMAMLALNEAPRLRAAYETATRAVQKAGIENYEIIISTVTDANGYQDGSSDIASQIAKEDPHVKAFHIPYFPGMGFQFRECVKKAQYDYIIMVPGANHILEETLVNIFNHAGLAPLVITYTKNPEARPLFVRFVSKGFVVLCNTLFGLHMKYFNGICLYPRKLLLQVPMLADSPSYNAEILIYLLKSGINYIEVEQELNPVSASVPGRTFMFRSVLGSVKTLAALFWKIRFQGKRIPIEQI